MDEKEVIAALTGIFEDRVREAPDMRTPLRVAYWEWCGEKFKDGTLKKLRRQYAKLHPDISKLEAILLEGGAIKPGMKAQWVKGTWGTPSAVSTTEIPGIISEVWIYRSTDQAYTMHNGKVWAIHKTPSR